MKRDTSYQEKTRQGKGVNETIRHKKWGGLSVEMAWLSCFRHAAIRSSRVVWYKEMR